MAGAWGKVPPRPHPPGVAGSQNGLPQEAGSQTAAEAGIGGLGACGQETHQDGVGSRDVGESPAQQADPGPSRERPVQEKRGSGVGPGHLVALSP